MPEKRSLLGVYEGYTEEVADGYQRESRYLPMRDGCRIAIDVLHPTNGGAPISEPSPTVLHATPYRRAFELTGLGSSAARYIEELRSMEPGELVTQYEERPIARDLIHHGYRFVSVDIRGTGASFGAEYGDSWLAGHDMAAVIDWICEQPWSSGRVGMVGISYEGMMQFFTAAHRPEGLKCIAPQYPGLPQCYVDGGLAIQQLRPGLGAAAQGHFRERTGRPGRWAGRRAAARGGGGGALARPLPLGGDVLGRWTRAM